MLSIIWNTILVNPILNILSGFVVLTHSLGIAIILLTLVIKVGTLPMVLPSIKTMKKQRDLQPELDILKKKYGDDKKKFAEMQMALFKEHGINPASGCLMQFITMFVFIALYTVIRLFADSKGVNLDHVNERLYWGFLHLNTSFLPLEVDSAGVQNIKFLIWNLTSPDKSFVLPVLAGVLQFLQSKMSLPYVEAATKVAEKTPDPADDMALTMQKQMMYMFPAMMIFFGFSLSSGVMLYMVFNTVFSIVQTYFMSGLGGLRPWIEKLGVKNKWIK